MSACDENLMAPEEEGNDGGNESGIVVDGNEIRLDLSKDAAKPLATEGGFLLISSAKAMAANVDGSTIRAFTSTCTHQECTIDSFQGNVFKCPCHGSQYDASGEVVQGPAPQALAEYSVTRSGDMVTITK